MSTYEKHGHRWAIIAKSGEILGFAADEATARRWAATPDLLAACKDSCAQVESPDLPKRLGANWPDELAALASRLRVISCLLSDGNRESMIVWATGLDEKAEQIRAAIAKAEGQS